MATWRSGDAAVCKTAYPGSIPGVASNLRSRSEEGCRACLHAARFGKAGVPMYLVYHPDRPDEPRLLSEVLTVDSVVAALAGK